MKIAKVVASAMSSTTFYKRKKLEVLAREALGTAKINSGERAAMKAVSYVQKYMGNVVKTHAEPGKNAGDRYLYIAGLKNKETAISDSCARTELLVCVSYPPELPQFRMSGLFIIRCATISADGSWPAAASIAVYSSRESSMTSPSAAMLSTEIV